MSTSALERVIKRANARSSPTPVEACEMCSEPVPADHRHLLDTDAGQTLCCCQACSILFNREAASQGHYRLIPQRRLSLTGVDPAALGVPVGLAFFVRQPDGQVVANYPSPAGPTQWEIDPQAWSAARQACPELDELAPQVEALLLNTVATADGRGRREAWIAPLDDCYRLVAMVRREWKGLSGGDSVRPAIDEFFEEMRRTGGPHQGR